MHKFKSAVVLAGGKSTRMGFDKQFLKTDCGSVGEHIIAQLQKRFDDILISSPTPRLYKGKKVRVIADIYPGVGPLAGIHATLTEAKSRAVFVIACDMPFIEISYIDYMITQLQTRRYDACVTKSGGFLEPMHAFYCRSALPTLERELAAGRYSLQAFLQKINTLIISEEEAAKYFPDGRAFTNLNTPEEYAKFRKEWKQHIFDKQRGDESARNKRI